MENILVKKLTPSSIVPTKAYLGDAGWDLYANITEPIHIEFGRRALIPIGCAFAIPEGYYGRIADRSGHAWKCGMHVLGGVIDSHYRGEVKVVLANLGCDEGFIVKKGDKIAQMVITKIHTGNMTVVDDLEITQRNTGGFGSSDNKMRIDNKMSNNKTNRVSLESMSAKEFYKSFDNFLQNKD